MTEITKVGVGVVILKPSSFNTQVLLGKRKSSHGDGEWGLPGGHLEYMESFADATIREITEELGTDIKYTYPQAVSVINLTEYAPKHYIDIGMVCTWISGEPQLMEPDKCSEWKWFDLWNFQDASPRFATIDSILYHIMDPFMSQVIVDSNNGC